MGTYTSNTTIKVSGGVGIYGGTVPANCYYIIDYMHDNSGGSITLGTVPLCITRHYGPGDTVLAGFTVDFYDGAGTLRIAAYAAASGVQFANTP